MKPEKIAKLIGIASLMTLSVVQLYLFYSAFVNGGAIIVAIDNYGEATLEFIILTLAIPFMVYFIKSFFDEISEDEMRVTDEVQLNNVLINILARLEMIEDKLDKGLKQ